MIRDTLVIALEASWEQDPVMMEGKLWDVVDAYNMKLPTKEKKLQMPLSCQKTAQSLVNQCFWFDF